MTNTAPTLAWNTLDDGAEKWWRAFRTNPRRTYDLFRVNKRSCWEAIVYGYQPGNRMTRLRARDFPFGRGALEAARAWLENDGREPGLQAAQPQRHEAPRGIQ